MSIMIRDDVQLEEKEMKMERVEEGEEKKER